MIVFVMMMTITIKISEDEDKNEYYSCKILLKKEITRLVKSKKFKFVKLDCLMEMHSSCLEKRFLSLRENKIVSYREVR